LMGEWWTRLDLDIPEKVPDDLVTVEACTRFVRRKVRELAEVAHELQVAQAQAESETDKATCVHLGESLDRLTDTTADLIFEVVKRSARLAEAPRSDQ
jgi:hypothetical protein